MPPPSRHLRSQVPARTKSSQPNKPESEPALNETALVQAIQTLDATWKGMKLQANVEVMEGTRIHSSTQVSEALRDALCTFLEIAACFNKPELANKANLVTVCTARVLGCIRRFVTGCVDTEHSIGECCKRKCEQRLIQVALLSILFSVCREPEIACNVVKENLHNFLIKMCVGLGDEAISQERLVADYQDEGSFDPYDLMIAIDPFDWCYQPLCTRLLKENTHEFFIPVGIRPLICLLRGNAIPTDEVSEFEQRAHTQKGFSEKSPRRRKLPSIFNFPLRDANSCMDVSTKANQHKLAPLRCKTRSSWLEHRENRGLWKTVLHDGAIVHLAVRSLIALAICLPRQSPEFKVLLRDVEHLRRVFQTYIRLPSQSQDLEKSLALTHLLDDEILRVELLPIQVVATQVSTLKRLACSALSIFGEERKATLIENIPAQLAATSGRRTLRPIKKKGDVTEGVKKQRGYDSLSVQVRLKAASNAAQSEFEETSLHQHNADTRKNQHRLTIRKMCADVESLRSHLVESLETLCSGRQHPDPQQTFSDWIKSLPTLETLERERRYQQEMRQRQILEQQYQREAIRRRERDECTLMYVNDYNVPEENELSVQQEKHEQILRMQAEIRQLEQSDLSGDSKIKVKANGEQELSKKEKLAIQERQRLLQLEDQRHEGRELERMRREDLYYVERILQAKAKAKEEQQKREKSEVLQKNGIEEQQRYIARMRLLDEEKRVAEREAIGMRMEDLFGRQIRFREAEKVKERLQNEWHERKKMQAEEHECRSQWILWDRMLDKQHQEELKQQRAEARSLKRQQLRQEKEIKAAWIESWDESGNRYFYNSITGMSQWEPPSI